MVAAAWPTSTRAASRHPKGLQEGRGKTPPGTARPHVGQMPAGVSGLSAGNPICGHPHGFARDSQPQTRNPDKNETALPHRASGELADQGGSRIKKTSRPMPHHPCHTTIRMKTAEASRARAERRDCGASTLFSCSWRGPPKTADLQKAHTQSTAQIMAAGPPVHVCVPDRIRAQPHLHHPRLNARRVRNFR